VICGRKSNASANKAGEVLGERSNGLKCSHFRKGGTEKKKNKGVQYGTGMPRLEDEKQKGSEMIGQSKERAPVENASKTKRSFHWGTERRDIGIAHLRG